MDFELSPQGQARRDQILELALRQARRQRSRRQAFRGAFICIALAGVTMALSQAPRRPQEPPRDTTAKAPITPGPPPADRAGAGKVVFERIETDPTIARRLAVPAATPKWERIDDDQLCHELAQAGQPAGLAKIGDKVTLIFYGHAR